MVRTINDAWNDGFKIHNTNPEKAMEFYQEAIDMSNGNPHVYLYTNMADCYNQLKDYDKTEEYYTLAEKNGFEKLEYKYSSSAYNSYAWFLYDIKKDYKRALIFAKIAVSLSPGEANYLDTICQVLEKLDDKNNLLRYLSKLNKLNPSYEATKDLLDKYKDELVDFYNNYWQKVDKKTVIEEILTSLNIPEDLFDYILAKTKQSHSSAYYGWDFLLNKFADEMFELDDFYMLRMYQAIFNAQYYEFRVYEFLKKQLGTTKDGIYKTMEILFKTNLAETRIIATAVNNYQGFASELGEALGKLLKDRLTPKELKNFFKTITTSYYETEKTVFAQVLLSIDYDLYVTDIKNLFTNLPYTTNNNLILHLIKDEEFIKNTYLSQIEKWYDYYVKYYKYNPLFKKDLLNFIKTGKKSADFDNEIKEIEAKESKWDGAFCNAFIYNNKFDSNSDFFKRIFYLSSKFNAYVTVERSIDELYNNKSFEKIEKAMNKYDISFDAYVDFFAMKSADKYYQWANDWLNIMIEKDFDKSLKILENAEAKVLLNVLPTFNKLNKEKTYPVLIKNASQSSKQLKALIVELLSGYEQGIEDFKKMLKSKKQDEREVGVKLLATVKKEEFDEMLKALYETEKSNGVKNAINEYFKTGTKIEATKEGIKTEISSILSINKESILKASESFKMKGSKEPVSGISFLNVSSLPKLLWKDDFNIVPQETIYYFLSTFKRTESVIPDYEGIQIGTLFEEKSLNIFVETVFNRWNDDSKTKWILGIIAAFGGNEFVDILYNKILNYVSYNRGTMSAHVVTTMAMLGTPKALQKVDFISRKEKDKRTKASAIEALETAAKELKLTKDELLDKITPDFGISSNGILEIDFGNRKFTMKITADLELSIIDENGKVLKTLPKANKSDDAEKFKEGEFKFKEIKKELKEQVKMQKERLESGLSKNRLWSKQNWLELFALNPLMKQFAIGLIWGIYENGKVVKTFRYMEDGSFTDINDDSFTIPENGFTGMVHPVELSKEDISKWKEQLKDYEIAQPFVQLEREIYILPKEKEELTSLNDFEGYMVGRGTIKQKLNKLGWTNGTVEDAGCFYYYTKQMREHNLNIDLDFMGDYMGNYDDYGDVPLYGIIFRDMKSHESKLLKDIPARLLSEIYYEIKKLADSGSGFNEDWKNSSW